LKARDGEDPFDSTFFAKVATLRARIGIALDASAGRMRGRGVSPAGMEFHDHQRYAPGDDPRLLDWNVLARWGRPFVKRFRAEGRGALEVVLDASASMAYGDPPKDRLARRASAAIALAALAGEAHVRAAVVGTTLAERSFEGRGASASLLDHLRIPCRGGGGALREAVAARGRRPAVVVASDFLDGPRLLESIADGRRRGASFVLVQILAPQELDPPARGRVRLRDAETGGIVEGWADERVAAAVAARARSLVEEVRRFARHHAIPHFFSRSDRPFEDAAAEAIEALSEGR
jgi:uncharacterized protein (DUF58 family)